MRSKGLNRMQNELSDCTRQRHQGMGDIMDILSQISNSSLNFLCLR